MAHLLLINDAGNYLPMHARSPASRPSAAVRARDDQDGPKASRSRARARSDPRDRLAIHRELILPLDLHHKKTGDLAQDLCNNALAGVELPT